MEYDFQQAYPSLVVYRRESALSPVVFRICKP